MSVKNLTLPFFLSQTFEAGDEFLQGLADHLRPAFPRRTSHSHQSVNTLKRVFINGYSDSFHLENDDSLRQWCQSQLAAVGRTSGIIDQRRALTISRKDFAACESEASRR